MFRPIMLTVAAVLLAAICSAGPVYYLATDITGAQTQIDVNHASFWTFWPTIQWDFGGGVFVMKVGPDTSDDIVLTVYAGTDATGNMLGSVTQTAVQFCSGFANCQTFDPHQMIFPVPIALAPGQPYHFRLTSAAVDTQSTAFFIKNEAYFISDINRNAIVPQPVSWTDPGSPVAAVPEPGTWTLSLLGAGILGAIHMLRRDRR